MKKIPIRQINTHHQELRSPERFSIRTIQDLLGGQDLIQGLHRHDFFFVLALKNGNGSHEIDFTSYPVADNSVFILRPGQVHQLELKKGCTGYLMAFNNDFYHPKDKLSVQRLRRATNKNYCKPEIKRFEKLHDILTYIFREFINKEDGYPDIIRASLNIFFIEFTRQSASPKDQSKNVNTYTQERFDEFLELLEKHIAANKRVSQYADLMNLSCYQLNEITKSTIGKTCSELINEYIILEAKRYLQATSNQIKDIADLLGYEDVSYFIRFFKKHTGYSPEAFRNNLR